MSTNSRKSKLNYSPRFEQLERRDLMTVTFHGGATMPNVEVQALYYGKDWSTNSALYSQTGKVEGFLNSIVHSSYMDMLGSAGYGVGRGSMDQGRIFLKDVDKTQWLTDTQIKNDLQALVTRGDMKSPLFDANRLYVVYVEPGVAIKDDSDGSTSQKDFLGYHSAFVGTANFSTPFGTFPVTTTIHYAVIAYPGGYNFTSRSEGFNNDFDQLTEVTSHELAEAVTDANVNFGSTNPKNAAYKQLGWYDDAKGEIGDIVNLQKVVLNGYCVQKESDKNDNAISPVGATTYFDTTWLRKIVSSTSVFGGSSALQAGVHSFSTSDFVEGPVNQPNAKPIATLAQQNISSLNALGSKLLTANNSVRSGLSASAVDKVFERFDASLWS